MSKKITQEYLESLTRQEIQALAKVRVPLFLTLLTSHFPTKEHGIRANLGTKVIINNLLAIL